MVGTPALSLLEVLRRHRRLGGWLLLGIWLALLPLRGWAETGMHLGGSAPVSSSAIVAAMPCHGPSAQAADHAPAMHAASGGGVGYADVVAQPSGENGAGCALCVLCHGPALPAAEARLAFAEGSVAAAVVPSTDHTPPALPLPERPPRS